MKEGRLLTWKLAEGLLVGKEEGATMQPAATNMAPSLSQLVFHRAPESLAAAASIPARSLAVVAVSIKLGSAAAAVIFRGGREGARCMRIKPLGGLQI